MRLDFEWRWTDDTRFIFISREKHCCTYELWNYNTVKQLDEDKKLWNSLPLQACSTHLLYFNLIGKWAKKLMGVYLLDQLVLLTASSHFTCNLALICISIIRVTQHSFNNHHTTSLTILLWFSWIMHCYLEYVSVDCYQHLNVPLALIWSSIEWLWGLCAVI